MAKYIKSCLNCELIDGFTKFVLPKPTRKLKANETIVRLNEILVEFGYPRQLISYQGKAFPSMPLKTFLVKRDVKHIMNTKGERPNRNNC